MPQAYYGSSRLAAMLLRFLISLGLALEVGWLYNFKKTAIDIAVKYYFDKINYAGLGFSYLF